MSQRPENIRILSRVVWVAAAALGFLAPGKAAADLLRLRMSLSADSVVAVRDTTLDADHSLRLYALAQLPGGGLAGPVSVAWSSSDSTVAHPSAAFGSSMLVDARLTGSARLTISMLGADADSSGVITVIPGVTASLGIRSRADASGEAIGPRNLSADSTLTLYAQCSDSDGNRTSPTISWTLTSNIGSLSASTGASVTLEATRTGSASVQASDGTRTASAGPITVVAGAPHHLQIEDANGAALAAQILHPGDVFEAWSEILDRDGNRIGLLPAHWSWLGKNLAALPAGSVSHLAWSAGKKGNARLVADAPAVASDTSAAITIQAGSLASFEVRDARFPAGSAIGDMPLSADSTLTLVAVGQDVAGNDVGEISVSWSLQSFGGTALLDAGPATRSTLRPRRSGDLRVVAARSGGQQASTGLVHVLPGSPVRVAIESAADGSGSSIPAQTLTAGDTLALFAVGRDGFGNATGTQSVHWVVHGGIGVASPESGPAALFLARTTGSGSVDAVPANLPADHTGALQVLAGHVSQLRIERTPGDPFDPLGPLTLTAGDSVQAYAVLRDAFGNWVAETSAVWSVSGDTNAGRVSSSDPDISNWFVARHTGRAFLDAVSSALGGRVRPFAGTSGALDVQPSAPVGDFTLFARPDSLRADGASRTQVSTGILRDFLGNAVADGTRVDFQCAAGSFLATEDLDAARPGLQRTTEAGVARATLVAPASAGFDSVLARSSGGSGSVRVRVLPLVVVAPVAGSMTPVAALRGEAPAMHLRLASSDALGLQIDAARLHFADPSGGSFEASLAGAVAISPQGEGELVFAPSSLSGDVGVGSYAPGLEVNGVDQLGHAFTASLQVSDSLRVEALRLLAVRAGAAHAVRGDTLRVEVDYRAGAGDMSLDAAGTALQIANAGDWSVHLAEPADGTPLLPNTEGTLHFDAVSAANAQLGFCRFDARMRAHGLHDAPSAAGATTPLDLQVLAGPAVRFASSRPVQLTRGLPVGFEVSVTNDGDARFRLDSARCTLSADSCSFSTRLDPASERTLEPGATTTLRFLQAAWPESCPASESALHLVLSGDHETGAETQGLAIAPVRIQSPARLAAIEHSLQPVPASVMATEVLRLRLRNDGGSQADLDSATRLVAGDLAATLAAPVSIAPGDTAELAFSPLDLSLLGLGTHAVRIEARGTQNAAVLSQDLSLLDSLVVTTPPALAALSLTPSQPRLTAGQTHPWSVDVELENSGGMNAPLDSLTLHFSQGSTDLTSEYTYELAGGLTPENGTIASGGTRTYHFVVSRTGTTLGDIQIEIAAQLHGETSSLLSWAGKAGPGTYIESAPAPRLLALEASQPEVVTNQANWSADLVVENSGGADLMLDGLALEAWVDGADRSSEFQFAAAPHFLHSGTALLAGGSSDTLRAVVLRSGSTPGSLVLRARVQAHDALAEQPLAELSMDSPALALVAPATLTVSDPIPSAMHVTQGSLRTWSITAALSNPGGATLDLASAAASVVIRVDGVDRSTEFSPRLVESPASLGAGTNAILRWEISPTPELPGSVQAEVHVSGLERATGRGLEASSTAAGPRVERPAHLEVTSLRPASAGRGTPVHFRLSILNTGEATCDLDSTTAFVLGSQQTLLEAPSSIAARETVSVWMRSLVLPLDAPLGVSQAALAARGTQNGDPQAQDLNAGDFEVQMPGAARLTALTASQLEVVTGQAAPAGAWSADLLVENGGEAPLELSAWSVAALVDGTDRTNEFVFEPAAQFRHSGSAVLAGGARDTLEVRVVQTGTTPGTLRLRALLQPRDAQSGMALPEAAVESQDLRLVRPASLMAAGPVASALRVTSGSLHPWWIETQVENPGEARLELENPAQALQLLVDGTDRTSELAPQISAASTSLGTGEKATLRWTIATTPALIAGSVQAQIHLQAFETASGRTLQSELSAAGPRLERPADLLVTGFLPEHANRGTTVQPAIRFTNRGEATAALDTATAVQVLGRRLSLVVPVQIAAGETLQAALQPLALAADAPLGPASVTLQVRGAQNGDELAMDIPAGSLEVQTPAALSILGLDPSQPNVTRGQTEPWGVALRVANSGSASFRIDQAELRIFVNGVDRTDTYTIAPAKPSGDVLAAASTDTLRFLVTRTGDDSGPATLEGRIRATDLNSGAALQADTFLGGKGSLKVQLPGVAAAGRLALSQTSVTTGQARSIQVLLPVRNTGEAALSLDVSALAADLVASPAVPVAAELASGTARLEAGELSVVRWTLGPFDVPVGSIGLQASVRLQENNRGIFTTASDDTVLAVQAPAELRAYAPAAPAHVTRAQARAWNVRCEIENFGQSEARVEAPRLVLRHDGADASGSFSVAVPAGFDSTGGLLLRGGERRSLTFAVNARDSLAGDLEVGFQTDATETNSGRSLGTASEASATVRLQREPKLASLDASLTPPAASLGQDLALTLAVRNDGEAALDLDPSHCTVRLAASTYIAPLTAPVHLDAGTTATLHFSPVVLPLQTSTGDHAVLLQLEGLENGNPWSASLAPAPALHVDPASSLQILALRASQPRVTRGQTRPWHIDVTLRNDGAPAGLEAAALTLSLGAGDVTNAFSIAPAFLLSGRPGLDSGAADTLRFVVTHTADLQGLVVVDADVKLRDQNSGAVVESGSNSSTRTSLQIESAAQPAVAALAASQPHVSADQRTPWNVSLQIRNNGGSPWRPDWTSAHLQIGSAADDSVIAPVAFEGGASHLDAGESALALFRVLRTGRETGRLPLAVTISGVQETDGQTLGATPGGPAEVLAQTAARAEIAQFTASLPRFPRANASQRMPLAIRLRNSGEAGLSKLELRLRATNAAPAETLLTTSLGGTSEATLAFEVRLGSASGACPISLDCIEARDANDSTRAACWTTQPKESLALTVEQPGRLEIVSLLPSQARVSAGQTSSWSLTAQVKNTGEEPLSLVPPGAQDVEMRVAGTLQHDYRIVPQDSFEEGGLAIPAGAVRTLRYRIDSTGATPGACDVRLALAGQHANEPSMPASGAEARAALEVDGAPAVRIQSTEIITWRRAHGQNDNKVSSGQTFAVRVLVENRGGAELDSVRVSLDLRGGNSRPAAPGLLARLGAGARDSVDISVVAGTQLSQPGLPEIFTAHIDAARDHNSGLLVAAGAPLDDAAFVFVQSPAEIDLRAGFEPAGAADGVVTLGQRFVLAANLANSGAADLTGIGQVQLRLPAGFSLVDGAYEANLGTAGMRWTLQAPAQASAPGETLQVRLTALPSDANTGEPAHVLHAVVSLPLRAHDPGRLLSQADIAAPEGARDRVLSTSQAFELEALLTGDADLVSRHADLALPAGWTLANGETSGRDLGSEATAHVHWSVVAGAQPGVRLPLVLRLTSTDSNDGTTNSRSDTLLVRVQRAALLALSARIESPASSQAGEILPGQRFTVRTWVRNRGEASVRSAQTGTPHGRVRLTGLPAGYTVNSAQRDFTLNANGIASADWEITAPAGFRPETESLGFGFDALPVDENSGAPVAVLPDSSRAQVNVTLVAGSVAVEAIPGPAQPAFAGERGVPLLQTQIANHSKDTVHVDSLGVLVLQNGAPVDDPSKLFGHLRLTASGAGPDTLVVAVGKANPVWLALGPMGKRMASAAASRTRTLQLLGDLSPSAPAGGLSVSLSPAGGGAPYLRIVESASGARVALTSNSGTGLESPPLHVVASDLQAYNAPNPFHVERETTSIYYRLEAPGEVTVRIYTLAGALVWETRRQEPAAGATLRSTVWDGRNGDGAPVRNGVYVCRVSAGGRTRTFKIAIVR